MVPKFASSLLDARCYLAQAGSSERTIGQKRLQPGAN
jgi:hypothetical protein